MGTRRAEMSDPGTVLFGVRWAVVRPPNPRTDHFLPLAVFLAAIACCFLSLALAALTCFCFDALFTDFGDLSPIGRGCWWLGYWLMAPRGRTVTARAAHHHPKCCGM